MKYLRKPFFAPAARGYVALPQMPGLTEDSPDTLTILPPGAIRLASDLDEALRVLALRHEFKAFRTDIVVDRMSQVQYRLNPRTELRGDTPSAIRETMELVRQALIGTPYQTSMSIVRAGYDTLEGALPRWAALEERVRDGLRKLAACVPAYIDAFNGLEPPDLRIPEETSDGDYFVVTHEEAGRLLTGALNGRLHNDILGNIPNDARKFFDHVSWSDEQVNSRPRAEFLAVDGKERVVQLTGATFFIYRTT